MRALVVHPGPAFSVADVHNGLVKGLAANGVEVKSVNLDDRLDVYCRAELKVGRDRRKIFSREAAIAHACRTIESDLYEFWPDVIIFTSCFFITPFLWGILERRPHHTVAWFTESPYEDDRQLQVAAHVDTAIINDPFNIQTYRQVNPRTWYMPHSYDPDIHRPGPVTPHLACDFSWVGTAFPSRIDFFQQVDWSGLDVKLAGNWQALHGNSRLRRLLLEDRVVCLDNVETVRLYQSSKVSANVYRKERSAGGSDVGWAAGPREIELAATGTFFIREPRGEGDELFPDAPTFESPAEFGDLVRWWTSHDDQREKTARLNREAIAERTFTNTAAHLLRLLDGAPKRHIDIGD